MTTFGNESLLAVLVTLNNLNRPLTTEEKAALYKAGQRLGTKPQKWQSHINGLMESLYHSPDFIELYQIILEKLKSLPKEELFDLLPSSDEIILIIPEVKIIKRAYFEGKPDEVSREICNFVNIVLKTENPAQTITKLNFMQKLNNILKKLK